MNRTVSQRLRYSAVVSAAVAMVASVGVAETLRLKYSSAFGTYRADSGHGLALNGSRLAWGGTMRPPSAGTISHHAVYVFTPSLKTADYSLVQVAHPYGGVSRRLAFDGMTNLWVVGQSYATNAPLTPGAYQSTHSGGWDGHLMKLDPTQSGTNSFLYATYLGGTAYDDYLFGVAVDTAGCVYVAGMMSSANMPTTANAYQKTSGGGSDGVFAKFDSTGGVQFVSYFGGAGYEAFRDIAVDADGDIYLVLTTYSSGLPAVNAYDSTYGGNSDMYLVKFDPTGTNILYSTYLGTGNNEGYSDVGLAVRDAQSVYICGMGSPGSPTKNAWDATCDGTYDLYFAQFDTTLSGEASLLSASFYGGSGNDFAFSPIDMALDADGNFYVVGSTWSTNLPLKSACQTTLGSVGTNDAALVKFSPDGSELLLATYLGGTGIDYGQGVVVDDDNNIYLTGQTFSPNFPMTPDAAQSTDGTTSTYGDSFITKLRLVPQGAVILIR